MVNKKRSISVSELAVFSMLGTIMFCSYKLMEALPNIHIVGVMTVAFTVVYRSKALIPIYVYVFLAGLSGGFQTWWLPYLYIWTVLWLITMLLPKNMPDKAAAIVYTIVCGFHGLIFGALYAPVWALVAGYNFEQTVKWIIAGLPFDLLQVGGNTVAGILILPLVKVLKRLDKTIRRYEISPP